MNDPRKYEFFAGNDAQGGPLWTNDFARIKPIAQWRDHMGCVTMTYNAPLKKFLMCVTDGGTTVSRYNTYLLESTTPDMVSAISGSFLPFFVIGGGRGGDPNLSAFLRATHSCRTWWLSPRLMTAFEMVEIRGASSSLMAAPHAPGGPLSPQLLT